MVLHSYIRDTDLQKTFPKCLRYCGNVFTELLPRNGRFNEYFMVQCVNMFTESLPNREAGLHMATETQEEFMKYPLRSVQLQRYEYTYQD
jgi:hypothetical protein